MRVYYLAMERSAVVVDEFLFAAPFFTIVDLLEMELPLDETPPPSPQGNVFDDAIEVNDFP